MADVKSKSYWEESVPVRLFRDNGKYKDDVFVCVNGQSVQIKRGETVYIKRKFAQVLEQSQKAQEEAAKMSERLSAEYRRDAQMYGIN